MSDIVERLRSHKAYNAFTDGPLVIEAADEIERLRTRLAEAEKVVSETSGMLDASIKRHRVREDQEPVTLTLNGERLGTFTYAEVLDRADAWLGAARAWKEASNG